MVLYGTYADSLSVSWTPYTAHVLMCGNTKKNSFHVWSHLIEMVPVLQAILGSFGGTSENALYGVMTSRKQPLLLV